MFHSFQCLIPTNTYKWERCCRKVYVYCGVLQSFFLSWHSIMSFLLREPHPQENPNVTMNCQMWDVSQEHFLVKSGVRRGGKGFSSTLWLQDMRTKFQQTNLVTNWKPRLPRYWDQHRQTSWQTENLDCQDIGKKTNKILAECRGPQPPPKKRGGYNTTN